MKGINFHYKRIPFSRIKIKTMHFLLKYIVRPNLKYISAFKIDTYQVNITISSK